MAEKVEVKGLKELRRRLRRLPRDIQKKVLLNALRAGGRPIVTTARSLVPVRSGAIKRQIKMQKTKRRYSQSRSQVSIGVLHGTRKKGGKKLAWDDPYYWRFIEFGTAHSPAQPFLRPAFESRKRAALKLITDGILRGIEKQARKL